MQKIGTHRKYSFLSPYSGAKFVAAAIAAVGICPYEAARAASLVPFHECVGAVDGYLFYENETDVPQQLVVRKQSFIPLLAKTIVVRRANDYLDAERIACDAFRLYNRPLIISRCKEFGAHRSLVFHQMRYRHEETSYQGVLTISGEFNCIVTQEDEPPTKKANNPGKKTNKKSP